MDHTLVPLDTTLINAYQVELNLKTWADNQTDGDSLTVRDGLIAFLEKITSEVPNTDHTTSSDGYLVLLLPKLPSQNDTDIRFGILFTGDTSYDAVIKNTTNAEIVSVITIYNTSSNSYNNVGIRNSTGYYKKISPVSSSSDRINSTNSVEITNSLLFQISIYNDFYITGPISFGMHGYGITYDTVYTVYTVLFTDVYNIQNDNLHPAIFFMGSTGYYDSSCRLEVVVIDNISSTGCTTYYVAEGYPFSSEITDMIGLWQCIIGGLYYSKSLFVTFPYVYTSWRYSKNYDGLDPINALPKVVIENKTFATCAKLLAGAGSNPRERDEYVYQALAILTT